MRWCLLVFHSVPDQRADTFSHLARTKCSLRPAPRLSSHRVFKWWAPLRLLTGRPMPAIYRPTFCQRTSDSPKWNRWQWRGASLGVRAAKGLTTLVSFPGWLAKNCHRWVGWVTRFLVITDKELNRTHRVYSRKRESRFIKW